MRVSHSKGPALSSWCLYLLAFLFSGSAAHASGQIALDADQSIVARSSRMHPIFRTVPPRIQQAEDMGRVAGSEALQGVTLLLRQTPAQSANLQTLLAGLQSPRSASYHRWLSPEAFAAQFGLEAGSINVVERYLAGEGASHIVVNSSRTSLSFDMNAARLEQIFATEFHQYKSRGRTVLSNAVEVELPGEISPFVDGVVHLNGFQPTAQVVVGSPAQPHPTLTTKSKAHFTTPRDISESYDIGPLLAKGFTGQGQRIAVVGQSAVDVEDIARFREAAALGARQPGLILVPDSGFSLRKPGDELEADIDLEYSSALAPDAEVTLVYTGSDPGHNAFDALVYSVDQNLAPIVSVSYGECEAALSESEVARLERVLEQANAQGQTVLAASGDLGATDCETATSQAEGIAQLGLAVQYPASSQYVTSVGGTMFMDSPASLYWADDNRVGGESAQSYVPEQSWNETGASGRQGLLGSGGGASSLFMKPVWQVAPGMPHDQARDVPDISIDAGVYLDGYVLCSSDLTISISGSCSHGFFDLSNTNLTTAGGTSFGAPIAAAMVALIGQYTGAGRLGNLNTTLYSLAVARSEVFHDIKIGGNKQPCASGSNGCNDVGMIGYSAGPGYDQVTGLGTPDVLLIAKAMADSVTIPATPLALSLRRSSTATDGGSPVKIIATLSGPNNSMSGTVQFYLNGTTSGSPLSLLDGQADYTLPAVSGTYSVMAIYTIGESGESVSANLTVIIPAMRAILQEAFSFTAARISPPDSYEQDWNLAVVANVAYSGEIAFTAATSDQTLVETGCYSVSDIIVATGTPRNTILRIASSQKACEMLSSASPLHKFVLSKKLSSVMGNEGKAKLKQPALSDPRPLLGIAQACIICFLRSVRRRLKILALNLTLVVAIANLCTGCSVTPTHLQNQAGTQEITVTGIDSGQSLSRTVSISF